MDSVTPLMGADTVLVWLVYVLLWVPVGFTVLCILHALPGSFFLLARSAGSLTYGDPAVAFVWVCAVGPVWGTCGLP